MENYIARHPILNGSQRVVGYEIVHQADENSLYNATDSSSANTILAFMQSANDEKFMGGRPAYLTFTPTLLLRDAPMMLNPRELVIQVDSTALLHSATRGILQRYSEQGYGIAVVGFDFSKRFLDIMNMVTTLKVDFSDPSNPELPLQLRLAEGYDLKVIAYHVDTPAALEKAQELGVKLFQGHSVASVLRSKVHKMGHFQASFVRLMAAVAGPSPEFDEIAELINLDVSLTFALLRIVNSAYFGLKNQVRDVKQALTVLGLGQLKQWIYLMSFASEGEMPEELIKNSFQRATFCQEMSTRVPNFPLSPEEAYLMGMFSTLDVLLGTQMEETMNQLPLKQELKDALNGVEGISFDMLELCLAYDRGAWIHTTRMADLLGISHEVVAQTYMSAMTQVEKTWAALMHSVVR